MTAPEITARRALNGSRNPYIVVTIDGQEVKRLGGARAARAHWLVIAQKTNARSAKLYFALRSAPDDAASECRRWLATETKVGRETVQIKPAEWATVVEVV